MTSKRFLIVNADDFGQSHGINEGIIAAHEKGIVTSASLMVRYPAASEAASYAQKNPRLSVGLHVDLKLVTRLDEVASAIVGHGLEARTVVSSFHAPSLRAVAAASPRIRIGFTYPEDRFSISRRPRLWPAVAIGLSALRASVPAHVPRATKDRSGNPKGIEVGGRRRTLKPARVVGGVRGRGR